MNDHYDCQLTLALPAALEDDVLDVLHGHPEWVGGYTVIHADGFGAGAQQLSTIEQVMGRSRRRLVQVLMRREDIEPLREALSARFQTPDMAWWAGPISGFGRFA